MEKKAFSLLNIPGYLSKPREMGITMMLDFGLGLKTQRDVLDIASPLIDIAKIAVGISGIISERVLSEKVAIYTKYQVDTLIGGQFLEYAIFRHGQEMAKYYFEEAKRVGFKAVEVSDNNLDIDPQDKFRLIQMGKEQFDLKILGEVGTKTETTSVDAMIEDIRGCLSGGAWKVVVEAAELVSKDDGVPLMDVIKGLTRVINLKDIIFELPGPWIKNVHHFNVLEMQNFLVNYFGPEVNVGNVCPDSVIFLETLRRGVGVTACLQ